MWLGRASSDIVSTSGSANARRCSRFCSSRSKCGMRDESGSSSFSSRTLQPILLSQTIQPARPTLAATDDGRFDQQAFPFPRGAKGAGRDGAGRISVLRARAHPQVLRSASSGAGSESTPKTSSREATHDAGRLRFATGVATMEPARGTDIQRSALRRSSRRRNSASPGTPGPAGCGTPDAAIEVGRNPGASKRVLEHADVLLRRSDAESRFRRIERRSSASWRILLAISTHSRPSPGAENQISSPLRSRSCGRLC